MHQKTYSNLRDGKFEKYIPEIIQESFYRIQIQESGISWLFQKCVFARKA